MTRLAAILLLALAALVVILARPRWKWERTEPKRQVRAADLLGLAPNLTGGRSSEEWVRLIRDNPELPSATYSSGSPESVTSRADNGTGLFV